MIVRDETPDFELLPAGTYQTVCVDVVDMGKQSTPWGEKHKCRIVWETTEAMADGRPFIAMAFYNATLTEGSNLRNMLEGWRGRAFTAEELAGFDLEKVVGVGGLVSIAHNEGKNGKTYANVSNVAPLMRDMQTPQPTGHYTRVKDREPEAGTVDTTMVPHPQALDSTDIPF